MLKASEEEIGSIREHFEWQALDLEVTFRQKVWDIHTNKDRWWVIIGGTNLYSQQQFPNMDLALTFHIGLILRIQRTVEQRNDNAAPDCIELCLPCLRSSCAQNPFFHVEGRWDTL